MRRQAANMKNNKLVSTSPENKNIKKQLSNWSKQLIVGRYISHFCVVNHKS